MLLQEFSIRTKLTLKSKRVSDSRQRRQQPVMLAWNTVRITRITQKRGHIYNLLSFYLMKLKKKMRCSAI